MDERSLVPVPVMFSMHGWNPRTQLLKDWLAEQLRRTYALLANADDYGRAAAIIAAGKVAVVLDGLDDMPEALRPIALRAIGEQATFRIVVLSRTAQMIAAVAEDHLENVVAIELQDVESSAAANYLSAVALDPPPPEWDELIQRIRCGQGTPLAKALNSPLMLSLARDYRRKDDTRQLLDFCDSQNSLANAADRIAFYLLDRVIPVAYARKPGEPSPRYDAETAQNALRRIAIQMNKKGTRDLEWWRISDWLPPIYYFLTVALLVGGVAGALAGVAVAATIGASGGLVAGAISAVLFANAAIFGTS